MMTGVEAFLLIQAGALLYLGIIAVKLIGALALLLLGGVGIGAVYFAETIRDKRKGKE